MNKASGGDRIPVKLFQMLKNDANGLINRNRITNVENKLVVTSGAREGDTLGDWD